MIIRQADHGITCVTFGRQKVPVAGNRLLTTSELVTGTVMVVVLSLRVSKPLNHPLRPVATANRPEAPEIEV